MSDVDVDVKKIKVEATQSGSELQQQTVIKHKSSSSSADVKSMSDVKPRDSVVTSRDSMDTATTAATASKLTSPAEHVSMMLVFLISRQCISVHWHQPLTAEANWLTDAISNHYSRSILTLAGCAGTANCLLVSLLYHNIVLFWFYTLYIYVWLLWTQQRDGVEKKRDSRKSEQSAKQTYVNTEHFNTAAYSLCLPAHDLLSV